MPRSIKPSGKVFRDPIHSLIRIDPQDAVILDLIDTPEFQRLRRIRQLGVSNLTYHGAEHSRFVHSLGVFNFAQRIIDSLQRRYREVEIISDYLRKEAKHIKVAALLHDIGHGPFSHVIERAFGRKDLHEDMGVRLIRDETSGIRHVLQEHKVDVEEISRLIDPDAAGSLAKDIISSQLDADRMDYLLRDSHATGVQYGLFDEEWIINALCVGVDPSAPDNGQEEPSSWRLCLDEGRGRESAEQFILARAHMNAQVYFHRVTRGYEVLLLRLFKLAAETNALPQETPSPVVAFLKSATDGEMSISDWLRFDESAMAAAFHVWASEGQNDLQRLAQAFLFRERLFDSVPFGELDAARASRLTAKLGENGLQSGQDWFLDDIRSANYKGVLYAAKDPEERSIESILIASGRPGARASPIEASDRLLQHLEKEENTIHRVYFERSRVEEFRQILRDFNLEPHSKRGSP